MTLQNIKWCDHHLVYNGIEYGIVAGEATKKYIYWRDGSSNYDATDTILTQND